MSNVNILKPNKDNLNLFLLSSSNILIPENSILIKWRPIIPKIKGVKKLINPGKKLVMFVS